MITLLSNKISSFFVVNNIIKQEDIEVYEYSLEILFSTVVNFVAIILIAVFTKTILLSTVYVLGFIPLRLIAGGYHAQTHFRCFLVLMGTYSAFLAAIRFTPSSWVLYSVLAACLISLVLIFILAPVQDKNKPVSPEGIKAFRFKSRIAIIGYLCITGFLLFLISNEMIAFSLILGVLSVALSLLASVIRNRITAKGINA